MEKNNERKKDQDVQQANPHHSSLAINNLSGEDGFGPNAHSVFIRPGLSRISGGATSLYSRGMLTTDQLSSLRTSVRVANERRMDLAETTSMYIIDKEQRREARETRQKFMYARESA